MSPTQIDYEIELFSNVMEKKEEGFSEEELKDYIIEELSKQPEKEKLGRAFDYLLTRA